MHRLITLCLTILILLLLAGCDNGPAPTPNVAPTVAPTLPALPPTAQPPSGVVPQQANTPVPPLPTATSVAILKPGSLFPAGLTTEPLGVITTSPGDKATDTPVAKDLARIIVQFN